MRIHSDILTKSDLHRACPEAVSAHILNKQRSRSRARSFDVALRGHGERHTRRPNTGIFGAEQGYERAATWDDWGWWLAHLFDIDPDAKTAYYSDRDDFHRQTNGAYRVATNA